MGSYLPQQSDGPSASWEALTEAPNDGHWVFDAATGESTWSPRLFEMLGLPVPQGPACISQAFLEELCHPDDYQRMWKAMEDYLAGQRPDYLAIVRLRHADGAWRWVLSRGEVERDADGTPLRMRGAVTDITNERRASEILREREDQLQLVADVAPVLISYIDRNYRYQLANRRYQIWFDRKPDEVKGRTIWEVLGQEAGTSVLPFLERALGGEEVTYERELPYQSGARWVHVSYVPDRDPDGAVRGVVAIVQDISERKREEARTQRLQALIEALSQSLTEAQVARVIVCEGSAALGAMTGGVWCLNSTGDALDLIASDGHSPEEAAQWQHLPLGAALPVPEAARSVQGVYAERHEDVVRRYPVIAAARWTPGVEAIAALPMQLDGRVVGVLGLSWNRPQAFVEGERQFMQALARQCAQALDRARLYEAEQRARLEAEAASRAKDHFLAALSHELRTPLTPVLMALSDLEVRAPLSPELREEVAMMRRNIDLEVRLIDDLLDVSRVISGKMSLQLQPVRVHELLHAVLDIVHAEVADKNLELRCHADAADDCVQADPARLQQVLWNLLKNSVKFTPAGGRIELRTRSEAGRFELQVIDTGAGIEPAVLPGIFNFFEQGGPHITRQFGGLGLGLAVSKAIVDALHGSLVAHSDGAQRGCTMTLSLPTMATPAAAASAPSSAAQQAPGQPQRKRVLVVEDHPDTAKVLGLVLKRLGYEVHTAAMLSAALEAVRQHTFDIVLSDLSLPDGSGCDLLRQIHALQPVKAIAVSGHGSEEDQRRTREAGFMEHLIKPIDLAQLQAALARASAR